MKDEMKGEWRKKEEKARRRQRAYKMKREGKGERGRWTAKGADEDGRDDSKKSDLDMRYGMRKAACWGRDKAEM